MKKGLITFCLILLFAMLFTGCTGRYLHQVRERDRTIREMTRENEELQRSLDRVLSKENLLKDQFQVEKQKGDRLTAELEETRVRLASIEVSDHGGGELDMQRNRLQQELTDSGIKVDVRNNNLIMVLPDRITFESGSATLHSKGKSVLQRIGKLLKGPFSAYPLSVDGHTDNEPIKKSQFKTNWRLSCERALSVLGYLQKQCGVDPERLKVTGYGEYHPVASNAAEESRKKNRRVEIIIFR